MIKTECTFFDGISSIPQQVELFINEEKDSLQFSTSSNEQIQWPIKEITVERIGKIINIEFGFSQKQHLKITDVGFVDAFNNYLKEKGHLKLYQKVINYGFAAHIAIALSIIGLIIATYVYFLPWVAEKATVLVPEEYDTQIGDTFIDEYIDFSTVDSLKTKRLNEFAGHLKLKNTKPLNFYVVESETVNAFALPNGTIVVFTGLLKKMKNYDELAGLIGHEVVHVNQRHTMKTMCRNLSGYIFISAVLSDVNGITAAIADNINSLQDLSFSRKFEQQADTEGLELMYENNINPNGMTNLFLRLKEEDNNYVPEFLSSHPVTDSRINYVKEIIKNKHVDHSSNILLKELFDQIKK